MIGDAGLVTIPTTGRNIPAASPTISRRVHEAGMKFGLWVGPNIVDSRIVGTLIPKQWVAQIDGKDQILHIPEWEFPMDQVCLGCTEYIAFLKRELTRVIRDFHIDWLKWDNSGIPGSPAGCNRADHGHQAGDGSYASLVGQYEIFDHLHATFPGFGAGTVRVTEAGSTMGLREQSGRTGLVMPAIPQTMCAITR